MNQVTFVAGQILGGMLANPNIVDGEIFWDDLIDDAVAKAKQLVQAAGGGVLNG